MLGGGENHRNIEDMDRVRNGNIVRLAIVVINIEIQRAPTNYIQPVSNSLTSVSTLLLVGSKMFPSRRHIGGG